MPLDSCPISERELAEFALGEERARLDAATFDRVAGHLAACAPCRRDYAAYLAKAELHFTANNATDTPQKNDDPSIAVSARNAFTRVQADLTTRAVERTKASLTMRWRRRSVVTAAVAAVTGAAVIFAAIASRPPAQNDDHPGSASSAPPSRPADSRAVPRPAAPSPVLAEAEEEEARDRMRAVAARMDALSAALEDVPVDAALARLEEERARSLAEAATGADHAASWWQGPYERLAYRARGTATEGPARLALSRIHRQAGWPREAAEAFDAYAALVGKQARVAAAAAEESPTAWALAEQGAKADAYYAETLALYEDKDYAASIDLANRLLAKYPTSAQAYAGQAVAARAYLACRQPDGVLACYRTIVARCPDTLYAREAAMALIRLLREARRGDEAIAACQRLRERFDDDDFRQFAMLREGELLRDKGQRHYPQALALFRTLREIKPDSPYAGQADQWIRRMTRQVSQDAMKDGASS